MAYNPEQRIRRWRNKAEEIRTTAEQMHHSRARGSLLRLADSYDIMADQEEALHQPGAAARRASDI
jgi:hypothetical protein